jgi:hypothetical protein
MQQYVKKSNTMTFPRKSLLKDRGLDTLNHSKSANILVNVKRNKNNTSWDFMVLTVMTCVVFWADFDVFMEIP